MNLPTPPPQAELGYRALEWFSERAKTAQPYEMNSMRRACYFVLASPYSTPAEQVRAMESLEVLQGMEALREMGIYK